MMPKPRAAVLPYAVALWAVIAAQGSMDMSPTGSEVRAQRRVVSSCQSKEVILIVITRERFKEGRKESTSATRNDQGMKRLRAT